MKKYEIKKSELKAQYAEAAQRLYSKDLSQLSVYELNAVIADVVKNKVVAPRLEESYERIGKKRIAVYFSIEFLVGRIVLDALVNTGLKKYTTEIFSEEGIDVNVLEEVEDAALGNGGLGRLAACFVESAATKGIPLYGMGIFYNKGLFKQKIVNGCQVEVPDDWTVNGEPWFTPKEEDAVIVEYRDTAVKAVPYVMPVIGYNTSTKHCASIAFPLTLWKAVSIPGVTNESAAQISEYLYPDDSNEEGKKLRLRQEYFFVSASMQMLVHRYLKEHRTLDHFPEYFSFQLNDTHPVMSILEFIRIYEENGYTVKESFEAAKKAFNYTNHTIMSEALEKWPISMFTALFPKLFKILQDLNLFLVQELEVNPDFQVEVNECGKTVKKVDYGKIRGYELFSDGLIHMAKIACFIGHKINGVAAVHSEIIKESTLHRWYELYPDKFTNKTNGVTPRRWIKLANPELAAFLDKYVGTGWVTALEKLDRLNKFKNNSSVLKEFAEIKGKKKQDLADYIEKQEGIKIDVNSIIDCQVKRIHEYKRQLMNGLRILDIYAKIKSGKLKNFQKTTFIIGGKAAPGYRRAKDIIQFINDLQDLINNDPDVNDKMKLIFITNFNVSYGEKVYAGADVSEQISTAGTEASGTSNMKFMMNGAVTLGTMDGANIEIVDEAGTKNNYIFGASVSEFERIKPVYNHEKYYTSMPVFEELLKYLIQQNNGPKLKNTYWDIYNDLRYTDHYFVLYDLESYVEKTLKLNSDYRQEAMNVNSNVFTRKQFLNTANSGIFSSDRTILQYADEIWNVKPVFKDDAEEK